jgi:hypothetical protein
MLASTPRVLLGLGGFVMLFVTLEVSVKQWTGKDPDGLAWAERK